MLVVAVPALFFGSFKSAYIFKEWIYNLLGRRKYRSQLSAVRASTGRRSVAVVIGECEGRLLQYLQCSSVLLNQHTLSKSGYGKGWVPKYIVGEAGPIVGTKEPLFFGSFKRAYNFIEWI